MSKQRTHQETRTKPRLRSRSWVGRQQWRALHEQHACLGVAPLHHMNAVQGRTGPLGHIASHAVRRVNPSFAGDQVIESEPPLIGVDDISSQSCISWVVGGGKFHRPLVMKELTQQERSQARSCRRRSPTHWRRGKDPSQGSRKNMVWLPSPKW